MKKILILIAIILFNSCEKEEIQKDEFEDCREYFTSIETDYTEEMADSETGLIEGDIIPDKNYRTGKAALLKDPSKLWTKVDGKPTIPYFYRKRSEVNGYVKPGFDKENIDSIETYITRVEKETGFNWIRFDSREDLEKEFMDGVEIIPNPFGSASHVGRQGGIQPLKLSYDFRDFPHEVGHLKSKEHEHNHPLRDESIIVHEDNIRPKHLDQFTINSSTMACGDKGVDFLSNMLYPSFIDGVAYDKDKPILSKLDGSTWERNIWFSKKQQEVFRIMYNK